MTILPVQITNDSHLPVNVCFEKSSLEGGGGGGLGSSSNPFEAHPTLATLQPGDRYTLPIQVAHGSPIHLQPAEMG